MSKHTERLSEEVLALRQQVADLTERAEHAEAETLEAFTAADEWMATAKLATTERDAALARAERAESEYDALTAEYNGLLDGGDPGGKLRTQLSELKRDYAAACQNTRAALVNQQRWQQEAAAARAEVARLREALEEIIAKGQPPRDSDPILWCGRAYQDTLKIARHALTPTAHSEPAACTIGDIKRVIEDMRSNKWTIAFGSENIGWYCIVRDDDGDKMCRRYGDTPEEALSKVLVDWFHVDSEPADGPRLAPGEDLPDDWTERDDEALGYAIMPTAHDDPEQSY